MVENWVASSSPTRASKTNLALQDRQLGLELADQTLQLVGHLGDAIEPHSAEQPLRSGVAVAAEVPLGYRCAAVGFNQVAQAW